MPHSQVTPRDAKRRRYWLPPAALVVLAALSFLKFIPETKEQMIEKVHSRIRSGQFEQLYDESGDMLHLNVTKEKFVRRMQDGLSKMRAVDGRLNFRRDLALERMLVSGRGESHLVTAAERLEGDGKSATLLLYWDSEGKFLDISMSPELNTPSEYNFYGVLYKSINVGGRVLD